MKNTIKTNNVFALSSFYLHGSALSVHGFQPAVLGGVNRKYLSI